MRLGNRNMKQVNVYRVHFAEFVERGSLYDFIHHNELDPDRNLKWTKGIASGMALLHVSTIVTCWSHAAISGVDLYMTMYLKCMCDAGCGFEWKSNNCFVLSFVCFS